MPRPPKAKTDSEDSYTANKLRDNIFGRDYEYFISWFASTQVKNGGQSRGAKDNSRKKFFEFCGGKLGDISIYGQESNPTTRRLAIMNIVLCSIEVSAIRDDSILKPREAIPQSVREAKGNFGKEKAETFRFAQHLDLRAA